MQLEFTLKRKAVRSFGYRLHQRSRNGKMLLPIQKWTRRIITNPRVTCKNACDGFLRRLPARCAHLNSAVCKGLERSRIIRVDLFQAEPNSRLRCQFTNFAVTNAVTRSKLFRSLQTRSQRGARNAAAVWKS